MRITLKHGTWAEAVAVIVFLLAYFIVIAGWVVGIAVAKGFWMTLGAVFLPPMAWVLLAQWFLGI